MKLKPVIMWTIICTVPASIITVLAFKWAGLEPGGWSGGIGAGIGVILGQVIAAKRSKVSDSTEDVD
jgi:hypothetical protein